VSLISLFSLAGVAIGSFALIVVLSGMNGFEEEVTQQMMGKDAHFELMRYHEEPIKEYQKITEQVKKR
jgi:lipoprotein-releasing system permease protein